MDNFQPKLEIDKIAAKTWHLKKNRRDPENESAFAEISFADLRFGVSFISGFLDHDLFGLVDIGIDVISWMFFSIIFRPFKI